jgi:pre-rRNA-processing protein IPI1
MASSAYINSKRHSLNTVMAQALIFPQELLIPHSSLLILFTTSAQTHIFPEIRIDAIRFLDIFLEVIPETLVSRWTEGNGHGNRILIGYLGILDAGTNVSESDGET